MDGNQTVFCPNYAVDCRILHIRNWFFFGNDTFGPLHGSTKYYTIGLEKCDLLRAARILLVRRCSHSMIQCDYLRYTCNMYICIHITDLTQSLNRETISAWLGRVSTIPVLYEIATGSDYHFRHYAWSFHWLTYCVQVYPHLDVWNVVEASEKVTIGNWCNFAHNNCHHRFRVRPFRCLGNQPRFHTSSVSIRRISLGLPLLKYATE